MIPALGLAVLVALPWMVADSFFLNAMILVFLFGTLASAWNLIGGYAGQLSFGHAVFFGLGAYTSTVLLSRHGVVPWVGGAVGAALAAALSLAVGYPTFRLRRHFFALATLALGEIARITFLNWEYVGAAIGLYVPLQFRNRLSYLMWDAKPPYYLAALALGVLAVGVAAVVDRSRMGIYLRAINQDEDAARALGLDTLRYKQWAMAVSAALTALAGTLYAQYVLYIDPYNVLTARISLLVVVIALIGGRGTVWGPVVGAALIVLLSEYTRSTLGHLGQGYDYILFGLLIMLFALYEPRGAMGVARRLRRRPPLPVAGAAGDRVPQAEVGPPAAEVLLVVQGVTKRFGGIVALDGVSLQVRRGEILGLIGPNGAGKSTLFDCITGFQRPDAGTVELGGRSLLRLPPHRIVHHGVVRTFQLLRIFPELTVRENLLVAQPHRGESPWAALRSSLPEVEERAARWMGVVGLEGYRDAPAGELSYGQQKLLSLAMALMAGADVILLDEPTAGVNPAVIQELVARIRELNRGGQTFVIIEHNMEVIDAVAHRVYFMADGRVLAEGTPQQVRQNPLVLEAYYGR
jgi:branched-chain amino acid transport system permease protein